jgi:hypothetical protein
MKDCECGDRLCYRATGIKDALCTGCWRGNHPGDPRPSGRIKATGGLSARSRGLDSILRSDPRRGSQIRAKRSRLAHSHRLPLRSRRRDPAQAASLDGPTEAVHKKLFGVGFAGGSAIPAPGRVRRAPRPVPLLMPLVRRPSLPIVPPIAAARGRWTGCRLSTPKG